MSKKQEQKPTIKLKQGARLRTAPQLAFDELERIREKNGGDLTPEAVVNASAAKRAVLHKEFEWDDSKAGHQYRLYQARCVIGAIEVVYVEAPHIQSRVYETVIVPNRKDENEADGETDARTRTVYRQTRDILQDSALREQLIARFIREAQGFRQRYAELSELAILWPVFDTVLDGLAKRKVQ